MASRVVKAPLKKKMINRTVDEYSDNRGMETSVEYSNPAGPRSMEPTNRAYPSRQLQIQQIQQRQMDVLEMVEAQKAKDKRKVAQAGGQITINNSTVTNAQFGRGEHSEERRPLVMMSNLKGPVNPKLNVRIMKKDFIQTGMESVENSAQEGDLDSPGIPVKPTLNSGIRPNAEARYPTRYMRMEKIVRDGFMQNERSVGSYADGGGAGELPRFEPSVTPQKKGFRVKKLSASPTGLGSLQSNNMYAD